MKDDIFLYQHKELLSAKSHSVRVKDLEDLRKNAIDEGLYPCYIIEYDGRRWYMVDGSSFEDIVRYNELS